MTYKVRFEKLEIQDVYGLTYSSEKVIIINAEKSLKPYILFHERIHEIIDTVLGYGKDISFLLNGLVDFIDYITTAFKDTYTTATQNGFGLKGIFTICLNRYKR